MAIDLGNLTGMDPRALALLQEQAPDAVPGFGAGADLRGILPGATEVPSALDGNNFELSDHLPQEAVEALTEAGVNVEDVDTPDELMQLLQQMHQSEGSGDPLDTAGDTKVGDGDLAELLAVLIESLKNGYNQQQGFNGQNRGDMGGRNFNNSRPVARRGWGQGNGQRMGAGTPSSRTANLGTATNSDLSHVPESGRNLLQAIAGQESGGNYYGPTNTDAAHADGRGIGAIGKYQMLGENVARWGQQAADKGLIPQDVAARLQRDPEAIATDPSLHQYQDVIAGSRMEDYAAEARAKGHEGGDVVRYVAAAWYSGDGDNMNSQRPQGGYPSIQAYTNSVLQRYNNIASA